MTIANRSRLEQETIINFNEEEKTASVYTFNKRLQRKLARLAEEYPDECRKAKTWQPGESVEYIVPKKWIKVNAPRVLTEEQKQAASERAKAMADKRMLQN